MVDAIESCEMAHWGHSHIAPGEDRYSDLYQRDISLFLVTLNRSFSLFFLVDDMRQEAVWCRRSSLPKLELLCIKDEPASHNTISDVSIFGSSLATSSKYTR